MFVLYNNDFSSHCVQLIHNKQRKKSKKDYTCVNNVPCYLNQQLLLCKASSSTSFSDNYVQQPLGCLHLRLAFTFYYYANGNASKYYRQNKRWVLDKRKLICTL